MRRLKLLPHFLLIVLMIACAAGAARAETYGARVLDAADQRDWQAVREEAVQSGDRALVSLAEWLYVRSPDSGASFPEITAFIAAHPDWPENDRLQLRAEQAIAGDYVDPGRLVSWFERHPPAFGSGLLAYAEARMALGQSSREIRAMVKEGWRRGDFNAYEEQRILTMHGKWLDRKEHIARTDRLLWERQLSAAARMLALLSKDYQALTRARIALLVDDRQGPGLLNKVPRVLRNDPGLVFARLTWRARRDDHDGVVEMLERAPKKLPYPEKWWNYRERQIREAVDRRNYVRANRLLAHHGLAEGADYAEAIWLKGWLQLEYLNDPQDAYLQFHRMYEGVNYAISKSRAAYWAGRAAERVGEQDVARGWFETASAYPATFYGQLAAVKLHGAAPLKLASTPSGSAADHDRFRRSEFGRIIKISLDADRLDIANLFIRHAIDHSPSVQEVAVVAGAMQEFHSPALGVKAAKRAFQHNVLLLESGFPTPHLGGGWDIELPLQYAIIRQESEFDPKARSRAGALGLMQLLPGTAKETAQKNDLPYAPSRLTESAYNARLGSHYLARLVSAYNGSYVKAIAAYNAGPGRVRQWVQTMGEPGVRVEEVVNWIERIPFSETRNYVQRVLENLQVYRHMLEGEEKSPLRIEADMVYN